MPKYRVDIYENINNYVFVVADSEQQAQDIAYEFVMNGMSDETIYENGVESLGTGKIETRKVDE